MSDLYPYPYPYPSNNKNGNNIIHKIIRSEEAEERAVISKDRPRRKGMPIKG